MTQKVSDKRLQELCRTFDTEEAITDGYDWDLLAAMRELQQLRAHTKELVAASKEAVCRLGECTTTLAICKAIFKIEAE